MSEFRRIEKMGESNIDCFSAPPKNEVVYFLDWHAACFSWIERPVRSSRIISALRAGPILSPARLTGIGESHLDNRQGSMDRAPAMAIMIKNVSKIDRW